MTAPKAICPPEHKHGESLTCGTAHACRCASCKAAHRDYSYWRRHMIAAGRTEAIDGLVDATGTRRRIQALMTLGWSQSALAPRFGTVQTRVSSWCNAAQVRASTHARVERIYDELCLQIPPTETPSQRMSVHRTQKLAARRRWVPPLAWDDPDTDLTIPVPEPIAGDVDMVVIELAASGVSIRLTAAERRIVIAELNARGHSDRTIALAAGCDIRTVCRIRNELGISAAVGADGQRLAS